MYGILMGIWAVAAITAILGCIPYAIWMVFTALKRRWRKLGFQIGIPLVLFALLSGASYIAKGVINSQYDEGLYGTKVDLGEPYFEYHSDRGFNGDGYSISVYHLPDAIRHRFENPDEELLSGHPLRPDYRSHWKVECWRQGPFDHKFDNYLNFALSAYDENNVIGLRGHFKDMRAALKGGRVYYAFFFNQHEGHSSPSDVDFFLIDLENWKVYSINQNT